MSKYELDCISDPTYFKLNRDGKKYLSISKHSNTIQSIIAYLTTNLGIAQEDIKIIK